MLSTATGRSPVAVVIHGGFWRAHYGLKLMRAAVRGPRRARLGGVEHRVPPARANGGGWPATFEDVAGGDRPPGGDPHRRAARPRARRGDRPLRRRAPRGVGGDAPRLPEGAPGAARACRSRRRSRRPACWTCGWRASCGSPTASSATCSAAARTLPDALRARLADRALPLGVPVLLTHGGRDDIVPPSSQRSASPRARAAATLSSSSPTRTTSATSTRRTRCGRRCWHGCVTDARARRGARRRRPARGLPRRAS